MSTILIVGGAGYIGSHTNKYLHSLGHQTIVLDNLIYGHKDFVQWGHFIEGDIQDSQVLDDIFTQYSVDAVMHFSAFAYVGESVTEPSKYYTNNVSGTINLLNAMARHGVQRFIFSSTCATFGFPEYIPIDEKHHQNPINPYGRTKLIIEQLLPDYEAAYGINSVCLRYFNAAGADSEGMIGEKHDPETHLIPLVIEAALGNNPNLRVFGDDYNTPDGTCIRDYIHVEDLASAHALAFDYLVGQSVSNSFNLGNGLGFSVLEVIQATEEVSGHKINYQIEDKRPGDPDTLIGDATKAKSILGWNPKYANLKSIIQTAYQWHLKGSSTPN